jgi:hypothetical protein
MALPKHQMVEKIDHSLPLDGDGKLVIGLQHSITLIYSNYPSLRCGEICTYSPRSTSSCLKGSQSQPITDDKAFFSHLVTLPFYTLPLPTGTFRVRH